MEVADPNQIQHLTPHLRAGSPIEKMIQAQWDERIQLIENAPTGNALELPEDTQRFLDSNPTIPPEHQDAFDALVNYEIFLARVDVECSYFEAAAETYDEYNKKHVEENALAIIAFFNN